VELLAALEPDQLKTGALVALAVLAVIAFLVMRFIQKLVFKGILIVGLVVAGFGIYSQRDDLDECQRRVRSGEILLDDKPCICDFAGFEVTVPRCTPPPGTAPA